MEESIKFIAIESIFAIELIVFCFICFFGVRRSNKLIEYLKENYPDYYSVKVKVSFLAGGPAVLKQHYHSMRTIYLGNMPDKSSTHYQNKTRFYTIVGIVWLLLFFATMIGVFYWGQTVGSTVGF